MNVNKKKDVDTLVKKVVENQVVENQVGEESMIMNVNKKKDVDTLVKKELNYEKMTVTELKIILKKNGLVLSGKKVDLIERIRHYYKSEK
jgi:hypothetical protein